ncbi:MAG: uridine kinase [Dehalococcoidia bacterium]
MKGDKFIIEQGHIDAAEQLTGLLLLEIEKSQGKFIVTIGGESGSGKSEIAVSLSKLLSEKGIENVILHQDDYFVYPPKTNAKMRKRDGAHIGPSEVRLDLLDQNLRDIINGKKEIEKPLVIFDEDQIDQETIEVDSIKVVIVDGGYTTLLKNVHRRVFIERDYKDTQHIRKRRAREEQGRFLEKILKKEHEIIANHREQADIIITKDYGVRKNGKRPQNQD